MLKIFEENPKLSWFATVIIGIGIFIISSVPSYGTGSGTSHLAVIYHFSAFFFFGLFLMISATKGRRKEFFIPAIILSIIYACLDELHQYLIPRKYCSFGDILTDSAGIFFAFLIYFSIIKLRR
ncbi:VanZ family protein [Candidatus Pacearchaeota archaeon]|nr:VanZ family protein [Candidatus Pacearchaeota archaeon]